MCKKFYVYAYLRSKDSATASVGTPYYIGKGSGQRRFVDHRRINTPKDSNFNIVLSENMSEIDSHQAEMFLIYLYGRVNIRTGILHNLTDGGEGNCGAIHSKEVKKKISDIKRSKRELGSITSMLTLAQEYFSGISLYILGEKHKVSGETIKQRLKEIGVKIRTRKEAQAIVEKEVIEKRISHFRNIKQSLEHITKRMKAHIGAKRSEKTRAKLRSAWVVRRQSRGGA